MERYQSFADIYSSANLPKIQAAKILIVGAGGIGCEILKNVALLGFKHVEVIDLDTIDVSNLNRQFLFRSHHVGQPKSLVAAEAVKRFNPNITIIPHHANIKDNAYGKDNSYMPIRHDPPALLYYKYHNKALIATMKPYLLAQGFGGLSIDITIHSAVGISYFNKFNVILNALDNVEARKHVNRVSLAAGVPLIDSGTTGYFGQVMPIMKGLSACYECTPKPTQKQYAICTIRKTPDKPVHCIVWAKQLLLLLLGNMNDSILYEDTVNTGDKSTYMDLVNAWREQPCIGNISEFIQQIKSLFIALFRTEVENQISMKVYKTASAEPVPYPLEAFESPIDQVASVLSSNNRGKSLGWENKVWSDNECFTELALTLYDAAKLTSPEGSMIGRISFDKDDELTMRFVCAASNLRADTFKIPPLSYHDAKGIAGNIIPAISTTNAIVAGIQVMEAVKVIIAQDLDAIKLPHAYCLRDPTRKGQYLMPTDADEPSNSCFICGTATLTLEKFISKVLKERLGFKSPCVITTYYEKQSNPAAEDKLHTSIIYEELNADDSDFDEEDDGYFKSNLLKALKDFPQGFAHVTVTDSLLDLKLNITVEHKDSAVLESGGEAISVNMFNLYGGSLGTQSVDKILAAKAKSMEEGDTEIAIADVDESELPSEESRPAKRQRVES